ncbi:MAG: hypothetical protein ACPL2N_06255 [Candidatus Cryosericum sp.]
MIRKSVVWELSLLTILQLSATYLFARFVPVQEQVWAALFFVLLVAATLSLRMLQSFILLIAGIMISSFVYVAIAWRASGVLQGQFIFHQLIIIAVAVTSWAVGIQIRHYLEENGTLKLRNAELEKYSSDIGVLTIAEFMSRADLIFSVAKRKSENVAAVRIRLKGFAQSNQLRKTSTGLLQVVGHAAAQSIRKEFDLAGFQPPDAILLLLQNTDERGVHIVIDRMRKALRSNPTVNFDNLNEDLLFEMRFFGSNAKSFKETVLENGNTEGWTRV